MPLFTFECNICDHRQEELCKFDERDTATAPCENPQCVGTTSYTARPELHQERDFSKGKWRMKAIGTDGSKTRVQNSRTGVSRGDS